ncbi:MAG: succinoglycan biosynthesis protein [Caulobacteraceae bacterium]|nr:succinoglycan biosynthesis protein [Caulobacteraceae bacterium]
MRIDEGLSGPSPVHSVWEPLAAGPHAIRIAYFAHDLSDPAVERRVRMLRLGGAEVSLLGFRRSSAPVEALAGAPAFNLGRTYDSRLLQRALAAGSWALRAGRLAERVRGVDVIIARNLEMLAVAAAVRRRLRPRPQLVYECLDIHRLMLADGAAGAAMRAVERRLLQEACLLMVSSPAFLSAYFERRQGVGRPGAPETVLVENKVLVDPGVASEPGGPRSPGRPWRILWPGVIRCRKSLELLTDLVGRRPDLVEVVIRGRPTATVFPDLAAELEGVRGVRYGGPFEAAEVPELYRDTHFTWAVDYFDEGLNSSWLLPNRLYEGGYYGSVLIALSTVEIGRWLRRHGLGVPLEDPARQLERVLDALTPEDYGRLESASRAAPRALFAAGPASCRELVRGLEAMQAA